MFSKKGKKISQFLYIQDFDMNPKKVTLSRWSEDSIGNTFAHWSLTRLQRLHLV
jgi:hypothetical protein